MPVIRVSNETYQKLLKLQAEDGNTMSIFMDRLIAKLEAKPAPTPPPKPKREVQKRKSGPARNSSQEIPGPEPAASLQKPRIIPAPNLERDYDHCPKCGVYYEKGTRGHVCDTK